MPKKPRPIRIDGDVAYVTLTKGYEAVIDAADVPLVEAFNWFAHVGPRTVYACRTDNTERPKNRTVRMHRSLLGCPEGFEVDHIDCDGLNNRRANLRIATHSQNQHNRRMQLINTSGFKGVTLDKRYRRWRADIVVNGKNRYLGMFADPEAAHAAYCEASAKFHGQFGRVA